MSVTHHIRAKQDSFVSQAQPRHNYGRSGVMVLDNTSDKNKQAFLFFPLPKNFRKLIVVSAYVHVWERSNNWVSTTNLHARRVKTTWVEDKITWDNKPDVDSATFTVATGASPSPDILDITAMLQNVVSGDDWHGIRLDVSGTGSTNILELYATEGAQADLRPFLHLEVAENPDPPVDLHPRSVALYTDSPVLRWKDHFTPLTGDNQAYSHVQIAEPNPDHTPNWGTLLYDSDEQPNTRSNWDLSDPPSGPDYTPMSDVSEYFWRVKIWDDNGGVSDWSEPAHVAYDSPGTVEWTSPADDGDDVNDTTPLLVWDFTPGGDDNQQILAHVALWRLLPGGDRVLLDETKWRDQNDFNDNGSGQGDYTPPDKKIGHDNTQYVVRVKIDDGIDSFGLHRNDNIQPGDGIPYAERTFFFVHTDDVDPATDLEVNNAFGVVGLEMSWQRDSTPDQWGLWVDGEGPVDVWRGDDGFDGGTSYSFAWFGAAPDQQYTLAVRAKTEGVGWSDFSNVVNATWLPIGIYLVEAKLNIQVPIAGQVAFDETFSQDGQTFYLLNRRDPVRINGLPRGFYGQVKGTIIADEFNRSAVLLQRLKNIFGRYSTSPHLHLIWGAHNYPVVVSDLTVSQWPNADRGTYDVTFNWWQTGNFDVPDPR